MKVTDRVLTAIFLAYVTLLVPGVLVGIAVTSIYRLIKTQSVAEFTMIIAYEINEIVSIYKDGWRALKGEF